MRDDDVDNDVDTLITELLKVDQVKGSFFRKRAADLLEGNRGETLSN